MVHSCFFLKPKKNWVGSKTFVLEFNSGERNFTRRGEIRRIVKEHQKRRLLSNLITDVEELKFKNPEGLDTPTSLNRK